VATCTPDFVLPATSPLVAASLGAKGAGAYDTNAACSGFLYALAQATSLVESGTVKRVLICGADVLSRVTDAHDVGSSILFGDGAGAAVVEYVDGPSRLGPFRLYADGSRPELLWVPPERGVIHMEGREVYRHAVEAMTTSVRGLLSEASMSADDVDLLVAHQANARIVNAVAERLQFDTEKIITNITRVGNTSAASIPLALAEAFEAGTIKDGDRIVLTAFGAGFAWGAGLMTWGTRLTATPELSLAGDARA
jgi:3-oxoacyl-[acyl-carrier-protein] synthase III